MPEIEDRSPTIFISYSQDSPEHKARVRALADRLIGEGVDCIIDQYNPAPPEGWPRWMDIQITDADYVLVVCSKLYYRKVMRDVAPGTGLGAQWEGSIIYNHMYRQAASDDKFIPILFQDGDVTDIPTPLQGKTHYRPHTDSEYDALYRRLTHQPALIKPILGARRVLPPLENSEVTLKYQAAFRGEQQNPWTRIQTEVFAYASAIDRTRPPILMVALAPLVEIEPIALNNQINEQFILLCHRFDLQGHLVRAPESQGIIYRAQDSDVSNAGRKFAWAHGDGAIGFHCDVPCTTTAVTGRLIDIVDLWVRTRRALLGAATWPTSICHSGHELRYKLTLAVLADAALKLDPVYGPSANTLSLPTAGPNAYRNTQPVWDESGVWDNTQDVDDIVEHFLGDVAQLLQCDWFEDRVFVIRDLVKLAQGNGGQNVSL